MHPQAADWIAAVALTLFCAAVIAWAAILTGI